MTRWNGGVIGKTNNPTTAAARGIFSIAEKTLAQKDGNLPSIPPT